MTPRSPSALTIAPSVTTRSLCARLARTISARHLPGNISAYGIPGCGSGMAVLRRHASSHASLAPTNSSDFPSKIAILLPTVPPRDEPRSGPGRAGRAGRPA